jgi:hypothetical protein
LITFLSIKISLPVFSGFFSEPKALHFQHRQEEEPAILTSSWLPHLGQIIHHLVEMPVPGPAEPVRCHAQMTRELMLFLKTHLIGHILVEPAHHAVIVFAMPIVVLEQPASALWAFMGYDVVVDSGHFFSPQSL